MKKLDFHFKPKDASSTKSFDTSQAGISDSLPESLHSFTRKHDTIPLQTIMTNIFLKNLVLAFFY
jgi:hypothetical protein